MKALIFKVHIFFLTIFCVPEFIFAQTHAELSGESFSEWRKKYDYNLARECPDIQKRLNERAMQEVLILQNTLAITRIHTMVTEGVLPKMYQEKFNKIVEARKRAGGSDNAKQIDPNTYMKKFDHFGFCTCRNDISKFMANEDAYKTTQARDLIKLEEVHEIKCLVDSSSL